MVGESVIVIKKLLQMHNSDKSSIIKRMTKLLTTVTVPLARASILWLVGEYVEKVIGRANQVRSPIRCEIRRDPLRVGILSIWDKFYQNVGINGVARLIICSPLSWFVARACDLIIIFLIWNDFHPDWSPRMDSRCNCL